METLGDKIYGLRKKSGLSQEQLAFEIDVSRQTISRWEANSAQPNFENIRQLCEIFKVDPSFFISEDEPAVTDSDSNVLPRVKRGKFYTVMIIILSVIAVILAVASVITGKMAFPTIKGDAVMNIRGCKPYIFIIIIVAFSIVIITDVTFIILKIRSKKAM